MTIPKLKQEIVSLNANTHVIRQQLTQHQVDSLNKNNFVILLLEHENKDTKERAVSIQRNIKEPKEKNYNISARNKENVEINSSKEKVYNAKIHCIESLEKNNKGIEMRMNKKL